MKGNKISPTICAKLLDILKNDEAKGAEMQTPPTLQVFGNKTFSRMLPSIRTDINCGENKGLPTQTRIRHRVSTRSGFRQTNTPDKLVHETDTQWIGSQNREAGRLGEFYLDPRRN